VAGPASATRLRVGVASCADQRQPQPLWDAVLTEQPDCRRRIAGRADFSILTWSAQLHPFLDVVEASRVSAQVS
jgi:hypothetical protein